MTRYLAPKLSEGLQEVIDREGFTNIYRGGRDVPAYSQWRVLVGGHHMCELAGKEEGWGRQFTSYMLYSFWGDLVYVANGTFATHAIQFSRLFKTGITIAKIIHTFVKHALLCKTNFATRLYRDAK